MIFFDSRRDVGEAHTRPVAAKPKSPAPFVPKFQAKLEWILEHRPEFKRSITALSLASDLAKGTIGNAMTAAIEERREPNFMGATFRGIAGAARVSLSWLMGGSDNPDGPDVPPAPNVDPHELARKRLGKPADQIRDLQAKVADLESRLSMLEKRK